MNKSAISLLKTLAPLALLGMAAPATADSPASTQGSVAEQIVAKQTALAGGIHEGFRPNHAKGIVVNGSFTPSSAAASLTKAAHLQNTPSKITVRFSDGGGNPTVDDSKPAANPRGMAIRFELPDGTKTDIVSFSINAFPVPTPEAFLEFLTAVAATKPDSPKPTPVEKVVANYPSLQRFIAIPKPAPVSFATQTYYGVNAFQFTNAQGQTHYARYRITPVNGQQSLTKEQTEAATANYLFDELPTRLQQGETKFKLTAQVAESGDNTSDPTSVWPDERRQIELGTISLQAVAPDSAAAEKALTFNPLLLVEGIAPSNDPVLLIRPAAYAVSVGQRSAR